MSSAAKELNSILPELLKESDKFSDNINNRMKVHSIFSEFEDKAHRNLSEIINDSSNRYKGLKYGKHLNSVINNSSKLYMNLAEKIFNDTFFTSLNLDKDREKYKKITDKDLYKQIKSKIQRIKLCTNISNKLNLDSSTSNNNSTKSNVNISNLKFTTGQQNTHISTSSILNTKKKSQALSAASLSSMNTIPENSNSKEKYIDMNKRNEELLHTELNNDLIRFNEKLSNYQLFIDQIRNCKTNKELREFKKNNNFENDFMKKITTLNYELLPPIKEVKRKEDNSPDMTKLLKFSRLGKNLIKINNTEVNENQIDMHKKKQQDLLNRINDKVPRYDDTISLVTKETNKRMNIRKLFDNKISNYNIVVNKGRTLPKLEDYDMIVKNKVNKLKKQREINKKKRMINIQELNTNEEERLKEFLRKKKENLEIYFSKHNNNDLQKENNEGISNNIVDVINQKIRDIYNNEDMGTNNKNNENAHTIQGNELNTKSSFFVTSY